MQTWVITVLGKDQIDAWFGEGTTLNIWNITKVCTYRILLSVTELIHSKLEGTHITHLPSGRVGWVSPTT